MSTNKQALRQTAEKAQEHGVFNMDMHSETVLALLDELEAKDKRIAELEAREVSVPNVSSERFWVEFNGRLVFREETYRSAVFKALDAGGITVKGDSE